jgi:outer membrane lipoprotein-sorting protein
MDRLKKPLAGALAAAMIAIALPACGDSATDKANDFKDQAQEAGDSLKRKSADLQKAVENGASQEEIQKKRDALEAEAKKQSEKLQQKGEDLQDAVDDKVP